MTDWGEAGRDNEVALAEQKHFALKPKGANSICCQERNNLHRGKHDFACSSYIAKEKRKLSQGYPSGNLKRQAMSGLLLVMFIGETTTLQSVRED